MNPPWMKRESAECVLLTLYIQPGAKKNAVVGVHANALKIRLRAQPVEGRANDCLIGTLAELLNVPRCQITLTSGATSRQKRVRVTGACEQALMRLASLANNPA